MEKYIAVTIGPIFDTINLASSPSALWAASYLFSLLSKNICKKLVENGIAQEDIISPYYDSQDPLLNKKDGVGLFHDRVIFKAGSFAIGDFDEKIRIPAIEKTVQSFGYRSESDLLYFREYFMVSAVEFGSEKPIEDSSVMLDCLELSKQFVGSETANPILSKFNSEDEGAENGKADEKAKSRNAAIIGAIKEMGLTDWQLFKSGGKGVRSLGDIAARGIQPADRLKKHDYFAVVRSDGDHMGDIIAGLRSGEEIRAFSQTCLRYCSDVAELVKEYKGVSIYSGGDDLLAILPVENAEQKTVFDFVAQANELFQKSFNKYNTGTSSLSFGVFVCYHKFPLYEALSVSADLLFDVAKRRRNALAVRFQKHAGQSEGLLIDNDSLGRFRKLFDKIIASADKTTDKALLSSMHKLELFKTMFNNVKDRDEIENLFKNTFDADFHKDNAFLEAVLPDFYFDLVNSLHIKALTNDGIGDPEDDADDHVKAMNYILRIIKFFTEKAGERK
ncbi:MAG: type III-B CRISPR-associated protein Cas10/Cmr2 [Ruminococcus sp.]|nr:type III-B CRISPR-associated protein Cas10/Cmr2 [Ruminococcus sp.]